MSDNLGFTIVDGIKCFSPSVANAYDDYPDGGFDVTDRNGENGFWVRSRNRLFKRMVENHVLPDRKTRFLEIGCGTGGFIRQIVSNPSLEITGSEVYLKGLLYAKKNLPDVDFIQFDIAEGTVGECFDMIAAFDVLEHIDNDTRALANVNSMLNAGGVFIVSVPQHQFLWSRLDEIVKHKRRYSRRDLLDKLRQNGFEISYCTSFLFVLFPLMLISRIFDRARAQTGSDEAALEKRTSFSGALNRVFDAFMRIDELLIRSGFSLPFGGTLLVVARKT
ncbi:class I SAM-dependent methyltransferase [soil metagenome]